MTRPLSEVIDQLANALSDAAQCGDWQTVSEMDSQVGALLMNVQPVPDAARPALARLRQTHGRVLSQARNEADRLGKRIEQLGDNREGLRAYEQSGGLA